MMTASTTSDVDAGSHDNPCNVTQHASVDWCGLHVLSGAQNKEVSCRKAVQVDKVPPSSKAGEGIDLQTENQRLLDIIAFLEGELQAFEIVHYSLQDQKWRSAALLPATNPLLALERDAYMMGENSSHPLEANAESSCYNNKNMCFANWQQTRRLLYTHAVVDNVLPTLFAKYDLRFETMRRKSHEAHERNRNLLKYLTDSLANCVGQFEAVNITGEFAQKKLGQNLLILQRQNKELDAQLDAVRKSEHVQKERVISLTEELLEEKERARQAVFYMVTESDMLMQSLEYHKTLCENQRKQIALLSANQPADKLPEVAEKLYRAVPQLAANECTTGASEKDRNDEAVCRAADNNTNKSSEIGKKLAYLPSIPERLSENNYDSNRRSEETLKEIVAVNHQNVPSDQQAVPNTRQKSSFEYNLNETRQLCQSQNPAVEKIVNSPFKITQPENVQQKPLNAPVEGELLERREVCMHIDRRGDHIAPVESSPFRARSINNAHRRSKFSFFPTTLPATTAAFSSTKSVTTSSVVLNGMRGVRPRVIKRSFDDEDDDSTSSSSSSSSSPTLAVAPVLLVNDSDDSDDSSDSDTSGEDVEDDIIDVSDENKKRSSSVRRITVAVSSPPPPPLSAVIPQVSKKEQQQVVIPASGLVGMTSHAHLFSQMPTSRVMSALSSSQASDAAAPAISSVRMNTINPTLLAALSNYVDQDDDGEDPWTPVKFAVPMETSLKSIENMKINENVGNFHAPCGDDKANASDKVNDSFCMQNDGDQSAGRDAWTIHTSAYMPVKHLIDAAPAVSGPPMRQNLFAVPTTSHAHVSTTNIVSGIRAPRKSTIMPRRNTIMPPQFAADGNVFNASSVTDFSVPTLAHDVLIKPDFVAASAAAADAVRASFSAEPVQTSESFKFKPISTDAVNSAIAPDGSHENACNNKIIPYHNQLVASRSDPNNVTIGSDCSTVSVPGQSSQPTTLAEYSRIKKQSATKSVKNAAEKLASRRKHNNLGNNMSANTLDEQLKNSTSVVASQIIMDQNNTARRSARLQNKARQAARVARHAAKNTAVTASASNNDFLSSAINPSSSAAAGTPDSMQKHAQQQRRPLQSQLSQTAVKTSIRNASGSRGGRLSVAGGTIPTTRPVIMPIINGHAKTPVHSLSNNALGTGAHHRRAPVGLDVLKKSSSVSQLFLAKSAAGETNVDAVKKPTKLAGSSTNLTTVGNLKAALPQPVPNGIEKANMNFNRQPILPISDNAAAVNNLRGVRKHLFPSKLNNIDNRNVNGNSDDKNLNFANNFNNNTSGDQKQRMEDRTKIHQFVRL